MTDDPQAEAADAYVKAMRPWHKNKAVILPAAVMVLILAIAALSAGGSSDGDDSDKSASSTSGKKSDNSGDETDTKTSAPGSKKLGLKNGDWRLDSMSVVKDKAFGGYNATGRFTYCGDVEDSADITFTVTLVKGEQQVGVLTGVVYTVMPDKSVEVQFISADKYRKGPYKYDFEVHVSGGAELPSG